MTSSSQTQLKQLLEPVCRQMKQRIAVRDAWHGLTVAAALAVVLGLYGIFAASLLPLALSLLLILVIPAVAAILPMMSKSDWREAARLVDRHYGLKDRTATALELAQRPEQLPMHQMQIRDAASHLQHVAAKDAVPLATPGNVLNIVGLLLLAVCLNLWPLLPTSNSGTRPATDQSIVEQHSATVPSPKVTSELARASQQQTRPYFDDSFHSHHDSPFHGDSRVIGKYFELMSIDSDLDRGSSH